MRTEVVKKIVAASMCALFMLSSCACNIADQIKSNVHERIVIQSQISVQELTRLIVSSINDDRTTAEVFSNIPSDQLDGLSYSYFYEYMDILRRVSSQDNNGKVMSFRIMGTDECRNLLGRDTDERFGQIMGAQLMYANDVEYPVYMFFSVNEDGTAYLSQDWVTSIINIYNYSNHYFTLLDESNADAVKALLIPGFTDPAYTEEVVYTKAQQLCDFYRLRVMSNTYEYEITRLVPWEMTIRIPETIAADGNLFEEHYVSITQQYNGNFYIDDKITTSPDLNLLYLVRGDERLIRVGNEYSLSQLTGIMGQPAALNYSEDERMMIVICQGVILRFDDVEPGQEDWSGTLDSIRLIGSSVYSIGYSLYVGMTRSQILLAYPSIDDEGYTLSISNNGRSYDLVFVFSEDDTVQYVKIYC